MLCIFYLVLKIYISVHKTIPFIVWTSGKQVKDLPKVGQYHVFHSVLDFFGISSPIFDETKNIFE